MASVVAPTSLSMHTKLTSIMGVFVDAAMTQICEYIDEGYAVLRLEIAKSQKQTTELRQKLQIVDKGCVALQLEISKSQKENAALKEKLRNMETDAQALARALENIPLDIALEHEIAPIQYERTAVCQVIALRDYLAEEDDELAFSEGDIINVLVKENPDWWEGELHGAVGLMRTNYVKLITDTDPSQQPDVSHSQEEDGCSSNKKSPEPECDNKDHHSTETTQTTDKSVEGISTKIKEEVQEDNLDATCPQTEQNVESSCAEDDCADDEDGMETAQTNTDKSVEVIAIQIKEEIQEEDLDPTLPRTGLKMESSCADDEDRMDVMQTNTEEKIQEDDLHATLPQTELNVESSCADDEHRMDVIGLDPTNNVCPDLVIVEQSQIEDCVIVEIGPSQDCVIVEPSPIQMLHEEHNYHDKQTSLLGKPPGRRLPTIEHIAGRRRRGSPYPQPQQRDHMAEKPIPKAGNLKYLT